MQLVLPMNYVELEQEEMMYLDDGALSNSDKAWIIGLAVAGAAVIGTAIWFGAWHLVAKIMGVAVKTLVRKTGGAAVISTLIGAIGVTSSTAWSIVNFCVGTSAVTKDKRKIYIIVYSILAIYACLALILSIVLSFVGNKPSIFYEMVASLLLVGVSTYMMHYFSNR